MRISNPLEDRLESLCYGLEKDHMLDNDIKNILEWDRSSSQIIKAIRLIKEKENSSMLKLPVDLNLEINAFQDIATKYDCIESISKIKSKIHDDVNVIKTLNCLDNIDTEKIIYRVQGPFSCLIGIFGSKLVFKWLVKNQTEIKNALEKITQGLTDYLLKIICKGVKIISFADPSGMPDILGERFYREFVASYDLKLLLKLEEVAKNSIIHICPLTSLNLERYGYLRAEMMSTKGDMLLQELISIVCNEKILITGHSCINNEEINIGHLYKLNTVKQ